MAARVVNQAPDHLFARVRDDESGSGNQLDSKRVNEERIEWQKSGVGTEGKTGRAKVTGNLS